MAALGQTACARRSGSLGQPLRVVAVAHPGDAALRQSVEQRARAVEMRLRAAVFARRVVRGGHDGAAEGARHELAAVADAQHGRAEAEYAGIRLRGRGLVDAGRAAGEYNPYGRGGAQLLKRDIVRPDSQ